MLQLGAINEQVFPTQKPHFLRLSSLLVIRNFLRVMIELWLWVGLNSIISFGS